MVHNLKMVAWDKLDEEEYGFDWALEMNEKFKNLIFSGKDYELINFRGLGRKPTCQFPRLNITYPCYIHWG